MWGPGTRMTMERDARGRAWWAGVLLVAAVGCRGETPTTPTGDDDDEPTGACGEVTSFDTTVRGRVEDAAGAPVPFADVWLEERNWAPGEKGRGKADADGVFAIGARSLPVVEDCWGVATQFWLVGEKDALWGEWPATRILIPAYEYGEDADMGDLPLVLE
jgi:hypothetical protein